MSEMNNVGLLVRIEAKHGKEAQVEKLLRSGLGIVQQENGTTTWYAVRLGPSTFGIFETSADEAGRQAHLAGRLAAVLMAKARDLLVMPPVIEKLDVIACKLPQLESTMH
jgi:quinol monooxygenase YgiN